ncbi:MAG: glycosyltransferase [Bacteroidia bacterium]
MKILYITPYYKPSWFYGGPPKCIAEQAEFLVKHHHLHIEVLTLNLNGDEKLFETDDPIIKDVDGVKVHYLPVSKNKFRKKYFDSGLLNKYLEHFSSFDLIHVNTLFNAFSRKGMQFAFNNHIPYVVTPHGMLDAFSLTRSKWMKEIHRFLFDDKLLAAAKAVQFTTENEKINSIIKKSLHPIVIPIGFQFPAAEIKQQPADNRKISLVFLGRINRKKGIDLLLKGISLLDKDMLKGIHVDIYGSDDDNCKNELEQLISELNVQRNISFMGNLNPDERDEKLRTYDALVLTSHQENFGLVVAEALSVALPVYISDKVNLCDFVRDNRCGWVSTLHATDISKSIAEIFHTPVHKRYEMGVNGFHAVRKNFSMKEVAEKYISLYQKIIARTHF